MAYLIEKIRKDPVREMFGNGFFELQLTRDKNLEENQITIKAKVFPPGTYPKINGKPKATAEKRVPYAEVLANYDPKGYSFNKDFIDGIFYALKAELAPHGYQLKEETKDDLAAILKTYIPKEKPSSRTG
jgi:hypothetical protein